MKDNNPFQLSGAQNAPDSANTKKRRVMLDGISQDYNEVVGENAENFAENNTFEESEQHQATAMDPLDPELLSQALNDATPPANDAIASEEEIADEAANINNLISENSGDDLLNFGDLKTEESTEDMNHKKVTREIEENHNDIIADSGKNSPNANDNSPISAIEALAEKSDSRPLGANIGGEKPAKQFTISIVSIILFVLMLAGVGSAIYFAIQNNKNANDLAEAKAKVQELSEKQEQNGVNNETTSAQFDALQEKITKLTNDNDEKQKTLDENKKTIDEQKKKIEEADKNNTDLTKKVQNISDLTTRTDKMLKKLESIYSEAPNTRNEL